MRRHTLGVAILVLVALGLACRGWATVSTPTAQVRASVDQVLGLLTAPELAAPEQRETRRDRIMAVVQSRFDFRDMAQRALARHWRDRSPAEQDHFVDLFGRLLKSSYVGKIEAYTDQTIVYEQETMTGEKAVVESAILNKGIKIPLHYRLKLAGDQWLVYDVVIEGVSLVSNYRSQFAQILERESFAELVRRLEERVRQVGEAD
ncbi:MAG: ABC transporter substrate-binding protein [Thermodesulfobacteriota bacterium]